MSPDEREARQGRPAAPSGRDRRPPADAPPITGSTPLPRRAAMTGPAPTDRDRALDERTMMRTVVILGSALAIAASLQAVVVLGVQSDNLRGVPAAPMLDAGRRVLINLAVIAAAVVVAGRLRIQEHAAPASVWLVAAAGALVGAVRATLQLSLGIYTQDQIDALLIDGCLASVMVGLIFAFALSVTRAQQRLRDAERRTVRPEAIAADALIAMQRTELRRRHAEADRLREALGERSVRLHDDLLNLEQDLPRAEAMRVEDARRDLGETIDRVVTGLAKTVDPEGIDRGLVTAVRELAAAVPDTIRVSVRADAAITATEEEGFGPLGFEKRLLLLRLIEEGIANALRHGFAPAIDISLSLENGFVRIVIADDGRGVELPAQLRTLRTLRTRLEEDGGRVYLGAQPGGGTRLAVITPLSRVPRRAARPARGRDGVDPVRSA